MTKQEEMSQKRLKFLEKLYDVTESNDGASINPSELKEELGFSNAEIEKICDFLNSEGLIETDIIGFVCITHQGIKEIEKASANQDRVNNMNNGAIQINGNVSQSNITIGNDNKIQHQTNEISQDRYEKIKRIMPELLDEMRNDLVKHPATREFVILKRSWHYIYDGFYLVYYLDDHQELEGKLQILKNLGCIQEITYNTVRRFVFEEIFVDYLTET